MQGYGKDAIEAAYCIFHQKYRVYEHSNSAVQKDEIECAIGSYVMEMNRALYETLSNGRADFLTDHSHFGQDLSDAVQKLETML